MVVELAKRFVAITFLCVSKNIKGLSIATSLFLIV